MALLHDFPVTLLALSECLLCPVPCYCLLDLVGKIEKHCLWVATLREVEICAGVIRFDDGILAAFSGEDNEGYEVTVLP